MDECNQLRDIAVIFQSFFEFSFLQEICKF